jgi:hypothetical protein
LSSTTLLHVNFISEEEEKSLKLLSFILFIVFCSVFFLKIHTYIGTSFNIAVFYLTSVNAVVFSSIVCLLPWIVYLHQLQRLAFTAGALM